MSVNQPPHQTGPRTNPNPSTNYNDPGTARWPSRTLPAKRQGRVRAAPSRYPCAIHSGRRPQTRLHTDFLFERHSPEDEATGNPDRRPSRAERGC